MFICCYLFHIKKAFYFLQNSKLKDTSSADARKGKDIQGIPWDRLSITREKYRQTRLEQYKNYENIPNSGEASEKVHKIQICNFTVFPLYAFNMLMLNLGMHAH